MIQTIQSITMVQLKGPCWKGIAISPATKVTVDPQVWYLKLHEEILGSYTILSLDLKDSFRCANPAITASMELSPGVKLMIQQDPGVVYLVDEILTLTNFWVWNPHKDERVYCTLPDVLGLVDTDQE